MFLTEINPNNRHSLHAQPPGRDQALMAANYCPGFATCEYGLNEAELLNASGQRFQLAVRDAARVSRINLEFKDRHELYRIRNSCFFMNGRHHEHLASWKM